MRVAYSAVTVASAAPDVHPQAHHQPQIEHNIQQITHHQQNNRRPGVLDAQQPAEQHQVGQRGGGR